MGPKQTYQLSRLHHRHPVVSFQNRNEIVNSVGHKIEPNPKTLHFDIKLIATCQVMQGRLIAIRGAPGPVHMFASNRSGEWG